MDVSHGVSQSLRDVENAAMEDFLAPWRCNPNVLGAMLTGSHALGLSDEYSDVDLYFILDETMGARQRGDHIIYGIVVEYNADPLNYIRNLQAEQHKIGLRHCARKVATGEILWDRDNAVHRLQLEAHQWMEKPLPTSTKSDAEMAKYYMWDQLEDLRRLNARGSPGFEFACQCGVNNIISHYAKYCGVETMRPVRMYQFLTDTAFRKKYMVEGFKDEEFSRLAAACMEEPILNRIEDLTLYAQKQMGGFALNGWTFRIAA